LGLVLAAAIVAPTEAAAQEACGERQAIVDRLAAKWGETLTSGGIQSSRSIIEVFTSDQGGTWTILRTDVSGYACVVATGTDWMGGQATQKVKGIDG